MITALIVDDEPLAHTVILHHLHQHKDIHIVGQCFNAADTLTYLAKHPVDLLFLDINMPALSGIEMLKVMANPPEVVVVSAYSEYAVDGFELDVADYVLKPVSANRLAKALEKVRSRIDSQNDVPFLRVKVGREHHRLKVEDIRYLEAYGNYVKVWNEKDMVLVNSTLKQLFEALPRRDFIQIHKSFVVNKHKVTSTTSDTVVVANASQLKIGKSYKSSIKACL
ncbi:response regulator [Alteromonas sp. 345S023]|uniref:Response regulator n=1 Tax=Alteromonas profundi TaxID=2696062 RepID=A0A7X5RKJ5_9ALTE|nr:LytTR family DNA-binding domain-containing protein [Alteromonas profundi]NDV90947.1 response regulator [Alteromonas profundi]